MPVSELEEIHWATWLVVFLRPKVILAAGNLGTGAEVFRNGPSSKNAVHFDHKSTPFIRDESTPLGSSLRIQFGGFIILVQNHRYHFHVSSRVAMHRSAAPAQASCIPCEVSVRKQTFLMCQTIEILTDSNSEMWRSLHRLLPS